MPIRTKRQAEVLKKLQDVIKHDDPDIVAGRKLAIKRWAETHIENVKSFKDNKLEFLYSIFQNKSCWLGTRLNNTFLRKSFTKEKIDGIDNPLRMYEMACSYCVEDTIILLLFQKRFESYRNNFPPGTFDGKTETEIGKYVRNSLLDSIKRKGPVFDFWIDRESGKVKEYDAVEGFDSAVKLKWSEGVEYFYNLLKEEDKEKKLTEAIIALSRPQCVEKDAPILDFCVRNIADKDNLLKELLQKGKGTYFLFDALIRSCFFDTVHDLVQCWCYRGLLERGDGGHSEKIFSYEEYKLPLSLLSNVMLDNPELNAQARSLIMELWRCNRFYKHKEFAVDTSNFQVPIENALAGLVVNWERSGRNSDEKKEILEIMLFAKDRFPEKFESFKEVMIENLRLCGREGMKESIDYGKLAEELFSKLEEITLLSSGDGPWNNLRSQSKVPLPLDGPGDHRERFILEAERHSFSGSSTRHDGSGDGPQSEFEAPSVSGVSGSHKKRSIFTMSSSSSHR